MQHPSATIGYMMLSELSLHRPKRGAGFYDVKNGAQKIFCPRASSFSALSSQVIKLDSFYRSSSALQLWYVQNFWLSSSESR